MDNYSVDPNKLQVEELEFSKGSFSRVYKGWYLDRSVCVKVIRKDMLDPDLLVFINREIDILKDLFSKTHKNIVEFIGVGERESLLFLVTELVHGGDLGSILRDSSIQLPWLLKLHIARSIAEGMRFLHSKNIMHRDLKSNNLLVGDDWTIKICDFGFAKSLNPTSLTNTICGTDEWMSPEVILGMPYNYSADFYRLEERLPQNNFDIDLEELEKIRPEECPEEFWKLALKCCSYYPKDRPDFDSIIDSIDDIITVQESVEFPPTPIIIKDPNFNDQNALENWFMLSNLPGDILDDSFEMDNVKEESIDFSDEEKFDEEEEEEPPRSRRWYCSIC
ncbi:LISK family protein kinase [Heterostelium album PN500]|uniref:non-specific serine/threonine protein kinase n=1 Tax=Heterostelium pallidum (strain ATCC 26659 / Pp 5 / PN500) TaxID=670386 RepID=D3AYU2_HETP5|nr:LISK family protein kinase [Heterostelium album PN500]EFA85632.1 LISK family protein kinase [Heterostelium album PN500]|eukprot:XP_020437739.1 LISK family protein kinase [Heterostelium album PN500]